MKRSAGYYIGIVAVCLICVLIICYTVFMGIYAGQRIAAGNIVNPFQVTIHELFTFEYWQNFFKV